MKTNLENKLEKYVPIIEKHGRKVIGATIGIGVGTIDTLIFEKPIMSIGIPLWELVKIASIPENIYEMLGFQMKEGIQNYLKGLIPYSVGASIPFGIGYYNEIITFIGYIYDKI